MSLTNSINFRNLRGDLFGCVTAAIISLPLALAFGVVSGAGLVVACAGAAVFFAAGTAWLILLFHALIIPAIFNSHQA